MHSWVILACVSVGHLSLPSHLASSNNYKGRMWIILCRMGSTLLCWHITLQKQLPFFILDVSGLIMEKGKLTFHTNKKMTQATIYCAWLDEHWKPLLTALLRFHNDNTVKWATVQWRGPQPKCKLADKQTVVKKLKKGTSSYGQKISSLILYHYCYSETQLPAWRDWELLKDLYKLRMMPLAREACEEQYCIQMCTYQSQV